MSEIFLMSKIVVNSVNLKNVKDRQEITKNIGKMSKYVVVIEKLSIMSKRCREMLRV